MAKITIDMTAVQTEVEQRVKAIVQKPSIGRIVHFTTTMSAYGGAPSEVRPALITEVFADGECGLTIFHPGSHVTYGRYLLSDEPKPGHWNWPPRV